jgi:23S rRNA (cytidine1920-2'-O)/16S rRNA (cytidine1409-2'-O)-methyltransferase
MKKMRLDMALAERGLAASRARARDAILRGCVYVDGVKCAKPGQIVARDMALTLDDPAAAYVSRAALKLAAGLDRFAFDPAGLTILDLGASTGGFTQVLLERGAVHVLAVDVGHGQMAEQLAADQRVSLLENLNARDLSAEHLVQAGLADRTVGGLVCDVSFISLKLALTAALALAAPGAWGVFLIKPQFEVGRKHIARGGLVRDPAVAQKSVDDIANWLAADQNWRVLGVEPAPLRGADGNQEYLLGAQKGHA